MTPPVGGIDACAFVREQKFDDLSRLRLVGTHECLPKAFWYVKLNHLFYNPLLDPVSLDVGRIQAPNPIASDKFPSMNRP